MFKSFSNTYCPHCNALIDTSGRGYMPPKCPRCSRAITYQDMPTGRFRFMGKFGLLGFLFPQRHSAPSRTKDILAAVVGIAAVLLAIYLYF